MGLNACFRGNDELRTTAQNRLVVISCLWQHVPNQTTFNYCTFELNRCTRNGRPYISTLRWTNLFFLDCVNSFGDHSSWRDRRTMESMHHGNLEIKGCPILKRRSDS